MLPENSGEMRLDKWLWAARFFKTRALAQKQIELGRVSVNNRRAKNSTSVRVGDVLDMKINALPWRVSVVGLSNRRGPAPEAQKLYAEDDTVREERVRQQALDKAMRDSFRQPEGRPTKRDRRILDSFKRGSF